MPSRSKIRRIWWISFTSMDCCFKLKRPIFKQKKGSATISLGLNYCSMGSSHSLSRDTVPLIIFKCFHAILIPDGDSHQHTFWISSSAERASGQPFHYFFILVPSNRLISSLLANFVTNWHNLFDSFTIFVIFVVHFSRCFSTRYFSRFCAINFTV
jgi:hypothetical protein